MAPSFTRSLSLIAALIIGAALLPSTVNAQQGVSADRDSNAVVTTPVRGATVDTLPATGPRIVRAGITVPVEKDRSSLAGLQGSEAQVGAGSNVAMMGVGVAAIVVGALIGGDSGTIIAVGGGIIGLIGLFRYLR